MDKHREFLPALVMVAIVLFAAPLSSAQQQHNPQPPPLPTMGELNEMYEGGDYRLTVQQIARVMRLRGKAAEPYDIESLQLLRGKALLALEDPKFARRALEEALKSRQPDVLIPTRALVALIDRSKAGQYQAKAKHREPISIYAPASRQHALQAVMEDELPQLEQNVKRALSADNLNPSIDLLPQLIDLNCIERLLTGDSEKTGPLGKEIGVHARDLIGRELTLQDERISGIERMANQYIATGGAWRDGRRWWSTGYTRRGLTSNERDDLYNLVQYLRRIEETARSAQNIATGLQADTEAWNQVVTDAATVRLHAEAVLDAEGVKTVDTTR